jgi:ABC-2 type transport system permease protein
MRAIYLKDSGFADLIPEFLALSILALLFNVWAILSYQKKIS